MRLRSLLPSVHLHRPGLDVVTLLCVGMVFFQLLLIGLGGMPKVESIYLEFGLSREGVLGGKLWQFLTHALLHEGWVHLGFNLAAVYLIGGRVQHILGSRTVFLIFWLGVLLGSVLHLALHPARPLGVGEMVNAPLVGASGGAMALLLAMTTLSPDSRMWPVPLSAKNLGRGVLLGSFLLFLVTPGLGIPGLSVIGAMLVEQGQLTLFRIGHLYHLGGGLAGWLFVRRLLRRTVTLQELREERSRREGATV